MKHEPVFLPEDRALNGKASQTFLRHFDLCPRSGYLYALLKGEARTPEMMRGAAFHEVVERATRLLFDMGEEIIPPEVVKDIVNEVLAETPVPIAEHDVIREMAYKWAEEWTVDPSGLIATETLFVLEVAGFQVRCKVDFGELRENGQVCYLADYKTSRWAPGFDDVSRKRDDGSLSAKNFQLILYALAVAFGVPVRVEGEGDERVEVVEPVGVAGRAQRFDLEFVYPAILGQEREDGRRGMLRRPMDLTRLELHEYLLSLEAILTRVKHAEETGDWPAVVSDEACGMCPAAPMCPIPVEARDARGAIESDEQASKMAEIVFAWRRQNADAVRELKAWSKRNGGRPIPYGKLKEYRFVVSERQVVDTANAVQAFVNDDGSFNLLDFIRTSTSTNFKDCKVEEDA